MRAANFYIPSRYGRENNRQRYGRTAEIKTLTESKFMVTHQA